MAGHTRTTATGRTRRTAGGKARRERTHLPPGEAEQARRAKEHKGARELATSRITTERDQLGQLGHALAYVRSASAKYSANAELATAVQALLDAGDRIYQTGTRRTK